MVRILPAKKTAVSDDLELSFDLAHSRVLFLTCPTGTYCREDRCQSYFAPSLIPTMRQPLEECEAGGAIVSKGGRYLAIDAPALKIDGDGVISRICEFAPEVIVLAVTFGSLADDLMWATKLNQLFPDVPIGLRGAPCYVWGEKLLEENCAVTFAVRGDYELVFEDLVTLGIERARGVTYRGVDGSIRSNPIPFAPDLDSLPLPNREGIDLGLYRVRGINTTQATIRVQRGCPFPCTYCLVHAVTGNKARHRSADSIVREVSELLENGVRFFYFRAETFSLDRAWTLKLCKLLAKHCPDARWVTTTRVECVDDEVIGAMRRAGCYGLSFGVDVASVEIGKRVKKPPRLKEAEAAMRLCNRHGVISLAYIMVGFVWDTHKTLQEAANFIRSIRPDLVTVHFAYPYPGTPYYEEVKRMGVEVLTHRSQAAPAVEPEGISQRELERFAAQLLRRHYLRPAVALSLLPKLTRLALRSVISRVSYR